MAINIIIIACMELLAIGCFCMGFIFGRYRNKDVITSTIRPIEVDSTILDPVSPEEQELERKLEEEARRNARETQGYDEE